MEKKIIISKKIRIVAFIMVIMGALAVVFPALALISLRLNPFRLVILSVISLGIAVFMFFFSHSLHKAKKWAWIGSVAFFFISSIGDAISVYFMGLDVVIIIILIIHVTCVTLLLSGKEDYWRITAR